VQGRSGLCWTDEVRAVKRRLAVLADENDAMGLMERQCTGCVLEGPSSSPACSGESPPATQRDAANVLGVARDGSVSYMKGWQVLCTSVAGAEPPQGTDPEDYARMNQMVGFSAALLDRK
jgi:hypothetical protein